MDYTSIVLAISAAVLSGMGTAIVAGLKENKKEKTRKQEREQDHLKLEIMDSSGTILQAIGFGLGIHHAKVKQKIPFSILYTIDENEFNGTTSLQLAVKDLRFEV